MYEKENTPIFSIVELCFKSAEAYRMLYEVNADEPHHRLPGNQLEFLDEADIFNKGGKAASVMYKRSWM
jgi:hypothetical protein